MGKKFLIVLIAVSWVALAFLFMSLVSIYRNSSTVESVSNKPNIIFGKDLTSKEELGILELKGVIVDSDETLKQIKTLKERKSVKAVVLRVDSPGGGISASQEIYEELKKLDKEKPVVASLSSVAASGGYYVALGARTIMANLGTLTGSIGVIMQLAYLEKLYEFIKITPITIKSGKFKDIGSSARIMTEEEKKLLQALSDNMHAQFKKAVSDSRRMLPESVNKIADGRVFSGQQALELGLVDSIGTFEDAIDQAAKLADMKDSPKLFYAKEKKPKFIEFFSGTTDGISKIIMEAVGNRHTPVVM
jgi:protease IV